MSAIPISSLEEPASDSNADEALDVLHRLWELATVEIMQAQLGYAELEGRSAVDDRLVAEAWLRLWRAEARQRELAALISERADADHRRIPAEAGATLADRN